MSEKKNRGIAPEGAGTPRRAKKTGWTPARVGALLVIFVLLVGAASFGLGAYLAGRNFKIPPTMEPTRAIEITVLPLHTRTPTPTAGAAVPVLTATTGPTESSSYLPEKDGMEMVAVPAGDFKMGTANGGKAGQADDVPQHTVYLDAFLIDKIEVTNGMYAKCAAGGSCTPPSADKSYSRKGYYSGKETQDFPVVWVNWEQARAYCAWAGRRLPSEAEWEKAARGADGRTYPWGENIDCQKANYWGGNKGCSGDTTRAGSLTAGASPYGALDMAGNVWEWVSDWYGLSYYQVSPLQNPAGPASGVFRVVRSGSWSSPAMYVRSTQRGRSKPELSNGSLGFRCAKSGTK